MSDYSIRFLGAFGSKAGIHCTTCIQLSDKTLIDAGNVMQALADQASQIESIFLTHSHLDHILDIGFFIDHFFAQRQTPLKIYGLPSTLQALKKNIFNDDIWPDFAQIKLLNSSQFAIEWIEIGYNQVYEPEPGLFLTPVEANHTVETCGYIIEHAGSAVLFSGDTYLNPKMWQLLEERSSIKAIVVDVSFPNRLADLARASKHMTPDLLRQSIAHLQRKDYQLYAFHLKPAFIDEISQELALIGLDLNHILQENDRICLQTGLLCQRGVDNQLDRVMRLNKIGAALSAEQRLEPLLEMIVTEAKNIIGADGGTLYMLRDGALHFTVAQTDSLSIRMGGTAEAIRWQPLPLYLSNGDRNNTMVAVTAALENRLINIADIYQSSDFSFEGAKRFDESNGYRSKSMLVVPLRNHEAKVIGVLQLLNKQGGIEKTTSFNSEDEAIALSLASQAAIAVTNAKLVDDLEALLESFLNSIIFMMGRKSPYTAGHINRMVALSLMMVKEVHQDQGVYLKKVYSDQQTKEIRLAALMHDIGKLATPETIMDKATKLDGHYDRIGLIRLRAQTISLAIENEALKRQMLQSEAYSEIEQFRVENLARLNQALALIEKSNQGTEFFPDEQVEQIQDLIDNPFVAGGQAWFMLTEEEGKALKVQKGTLTEEERQIINEHAEIGLKVLQSLPFPEKYKDIPHIAGAHHEKINGKGYPLGLRGEEISFEARILAIADIFEALTAHDRPYKRPNPLSLAMKILYFMAKDNDLDREIVKFFYQSGLYLKYAQRFLPKEQIDPVDIDFSDL
ncbi:GAF domain-containing protein [Thiomicrospira microaerophila]|uniref:HD domain-containing phosphohydrolase n=1 Tax=Thiomicrospira microaerophila TaxID=406020 RepID=UPI00200BCFAA|nr:HD domain-containing phosphohydrolase [Thiomicrospira microaerophila]UQB42996.1 GAF domain-containing protein [Thiomicrospira microaerophila]